MWEKWACQWHSDYGSHTSSRIGRGLAWFRKPSRNKFADFSLFPEVVSQVSAKPRNIHIVNNEAIDLYLPLWRSIWLWLAKCKSLKLWWFYAVIESKRGIFKKKILGVKKKWVLAVSRSAKSRGDNWNSSSCLFPSSRTISSTYHNDRNSLLMKQVPLFVPIAHWVIERPKWVFCIAQSVSWLQLLNTKEQEECKRKRRRRMHSGGWWEGNLCALSA